MSWLGAQAHMTEACVTALRESASPANMCHHGSILWGRCHYCLWMGAKEDPGCQALLTAVPQPPPWVLFLSEGSQQLHGKTCSGIASWKGWTEWIVRVVRRWQPRGAVWWAVLRCFHNPANKERGERAKRNMCVVLQDRPVCMTGGPNPGPWQNPGILNHLSGPGSSVPLHMFSHEIFQWGS